MILLVCGVYIIVMTKILLILAFIALTALSGCVAGKFDAKFPDGSTVSGVYIRIGDNKVTIKPGEFNQESEGKVPSGIIALLGELFK